MSKVMETVQMARMGAIGGYKLAVLLALAAAITARGSTTVTFDSAMEVEVNGQVRSFAKDDTFDATAVPCIYRMRPVLAEGERTFGVKYNDVFLYPVFGEGNWVRVALPDDGSTVTVKGVKVKQVWYVDAEHGNDDWDGTTDYANRDESLNKGPKLSLQSVHNAAVEGTDSSGYPLVLAASGIYSNGVSYTSQPEGDNRCGRRLRIWKTIGFLAPEGPEKTFIVGAPDPETGGCGENAVAGVFALSGIHTFLQGFTFTGCYTPGLDNKGTQMGAAFSGSSWTDDQLLDCVVSNNFAKQNSACVQCVASRTLFAENTSSNYLARYSTFASCVFSGNVIAGRNSNDDLSALLENTCTAFFCTFDLRNARNPSGRARVNYNNSTLRGCLVYGYTSTYTNNWYDSRSFGHPVFADADSRDYRLGMLSPAIDATSYSEMTAGQRRRMASDIVGRPPVLHDGKMRLGAVWNEPAMPVTVLNIADGGMAISGGREGTNVVFSADTITVTKTLSRPFIGFDVNGEIVSAPSGSYSFTPSLADGSVTDVKPIYDCNWYVDCVNGSDSNDGSASRPYKTIRAATTNALSGDVIHVAPGTYGAAEGAQKWPSASSAIGTRVVIPAGVTVESTGGAANTFIVGAASPDPAVTEGWQAGIGPGAVRCVAAGDDAVLRGFTLMGGYTHAASASLQQDRYASAFYSSTGSVVENCIVSNNVASSRTIQGGTVRSCRVIGNTASSEGATTLSGAAGYGCKWYNSVIKDNRGNATVFNPVTFENCTVVGGNITSEGLAAQVLYFWSGGNRAIKNSAILEGRYYITDGETDMYCTNCLVMAGAVGTYLKRENSYNTIFTNSAAALVDSDYRPILGSFAGIDAGDAAYSSEALGDKDIYGTPRILNGALDIGAVEYDWRPTFNVELGQRIKMTYASPTVTTNASGGVKLNGDAGALGNRALPVCVAGTATSAGPYEFTFEITGGSVQVCVGDVLVGEASGSGEQSIRFNVPDTTSEIRFTFTPDDQNPGMVLLRKFSGARGFSISFR